jgi:hypothetical protein
MTTVDLMAIHHLAGNCPASAAHGNPYHIQGGGAIYRRSFRSVTMRCNECGLLWTVTFHQLAKVARLYADTNPDDRIYKEWAVIV